MEDTQVSKDLIEIGLLRGHDKGLKKGLKKGRKEGFIEAYRQVIYNIIVKRFGEVSESIKSRLPLIEDLEKLIWIQDRLLDINDKSRLEDLFNGQSDKK